MSETLTIKELGVNELKQAFSIVSQLRTHLTLEKYIETAKAMMIGGYKVVCLFEGGEIVSYAGFAELINLYYGEHIWVYELVTDKNKRNKGYGEMLLLHIENYANDNGLSCVALSSGLQRENAHSFYENKMSYEKVSYVYKKSI
jgi:GNAT superfamily N-acetyltransferase